MTAQSVKLTDQLFGDLVIHVEEVALLMVSAWDCSFFAQSVSDIPLTVRSFSTSSTVLPSAHSSSNFDLHNIPRFLFRTVPSVYVILSYLINLPKSQASCDFPLFQIDNNVLLFFWLFFRKALPETVPPFSADSKPV